MFDPQLLIAGINAAATIIQQGVQIYQNSQATLSSTDNAAIHEALLKAEIATAELRPRVDAALMAASQR